jgi:hypothetical protein
VWYHLLVGACNDELLDILPTSRLQVERALLTVSCITWRQSAILLGWRPWYDEDASDARDHRTLRRQLHCNNVISIYRGPHIDSTHMRTITLVTSQDPLASSDHS